MKSKIKILVRPGLIRNKQVWLLYFLYDEKLNSEIKLEFKAKWCPELKCWWMDYRETYIEQLKTREAIAIFQSQDTYENNSAILNNRNHYKPFLLRKKNNSNATP
jgi:hypothetical protein